LEVTDHAANPGPGLEFVSDQINKVSDFHAINCYRAREMSPIDWTMDLRNNSRVRFKCPAL
jgi:hypothetical protein